MPAIKCSNSKWRWGGGKCIFDTKAKAQNAGVAIEIAKQKRKGGY